METKKMKMETKKMKMETKKSRTEAEKKLEEFGNKIFKQVDTGENPEIEIPIRSLSNVIYDQETKRLTLGDKAAKRFFFNVAHAKSFMQTLLVAAFCNE